MADHLLSLQCRNSLCCFAWLLLHLFNSLHLNSQVFSVSLFQSFPHPTGGRVGMSCQLGLNHDNSLHCFWMGTRISFKYVKDQIQILRTPCSSTHSQLPNNLKALTSRAGAGPKYFVELMPEQSVLLIWGCNQHGDWWEKTANTV